jgi:hypothetical protein
MKVVRLLKIFLYKIHSKVCIGKHLSDAGQIHNGLEHGNGLLPLLFNFPLEYDIRMVWGNHEQLELPYLLELQDTLFPWKMQPKIPLCLYRLKVQKNDLWGKLSFVQWSCSELSCSLERTCVIITWLMIITEKVLTLLNLLSYQNV